MFTSSHWKIKAEASVFLKKRCFLMMKTWIRNIRDQNLGNLLEHNLPALFLKFYIYQKSLYKKEVSLQLCQLVEFSRPFLYNKVKGVLQKYYTVPTLVNQLQKKWLSNNIIACCGKDGCLATVKRRAS